MLNYVGQSLIAINHHLQHFSNMFNIVEYSHVLSLVISICILGNDLLFSFIIIKPEKPSKAEGYCWDFHLQAVKLNITKCNVPTLLNEISE